MRAQLNPALLLAAACLVTAGCATKGEEAETPSVVPVQVASARVDSIRRIISADAVLYPLDQSSVMPKIAAPVQKFYINRGDHVKAGQLLAILENRDLAAAAAESKGLLSQAESNLRSTSSATVPEEVTKAQTDVQSAQQALDASQKLLDSRQKLFDQGALARKLVDEAQVAYVQARSQFEAARQHLEALQSVGKQEQVKGAEAQVESARAHYQSAQTQFGYSEIRSPISGVIADRPLYAGEMANPGTPLMIVMNISRVVARASVPQNEAATLKVGDPAGITQGDSPVELPGRITVVSPATDPASTTVQVWIEAENSGERFKPGSGVHVAITAATIPNAVVVPPAALLPGADGGTAVLVVGGDSVAHQRKIDIGVREADKVQILSGVSAGEQVVVVGGVGVADKTKVRIEKPGETGK